MKRNVDDFAAWRVRQENTVKPFPYVFPQMPPRFRRCCAFAKAVFLIQWGGFAVFALGSMILFVPAVVWGMELSALTDGRPLLPLLILATAVSLLLFSWRSLSALPQTLLAVPMLWVPVPILCADARGQTERERMPAEHKRTAHQICKTAVLPADYPVCLPGVQMQIF